MTHRQRIASTAPILAFGPFELQLSEGLLRRGEQTFPLRPKVLSLLQYLLAHRGRLVPIDELHAAVWGDTAVTPNAMTNVIGELRRLLDDGRGGNRYIETVPRRGYRFLAGVGDTIDAASPLLSAFVGRASELERLRAAFDAVAAGARRAVFISGEPGVGKSTLVDQFLASIVGATIARAACVASSESREAYGPLLRALGELSLGPRRRLVETTVRRHAPAWLAQMPWLMEVDEQRALARSLIGEGRQRLVREADALITALTHDEPLILVLDDLHWSDAATIELLPVLCQSMAPARLLFVGAYRPVDALVHQHPIVPTVAQLRRSERVDVLPLPGFSVAEVRACLAYELRDADLAAHLADPISRHCGGNPLFVKAVSEQLQQEGWLRADSGELELVSELDRFAPRLPGDLHDLIELQLQALSDKTLHLLEAVSVAGDEASVDLLSAVLEQDGDVVGDLGHDQVCRGVYLRLVPGSRRGAAAGGEVFAFTHALYERAVYNRIPPSARRRLHERIGRFLEPHYAQRIGEGAMRLALHFEAALDYDRAATYREQAALVAMGRCDYAEALRSLQRAQAHLDRLGVTPEIELWRARVLLTLANVLAAVRGFADSEVAPTFASAEVHAIAAGAPREQVRALLGLSSVTLDTGCVSDTGPFVERLLEVANKAPSEEKLLSYCHTRAARWSISRGAFADALAYLDAAQDLPAATGVPIHVDPRAEAEAWRSMALAHLGQYDEAAAAARRAERLAASVDLPWGYAGILAILSYAANLQRQRDFSDELLQHAVAHCRRHDLQYFERRVRFQELHREFLDQPSLALAGRMQECMDELARSVGAESLVFIHCIVAECCLSVGDPTATAIVDTTIADCERGGEVHLLAELWRLRGAIHERGAKPRRGRNPSAAEVAYLTARDIAAAQGSKLLHLRSQTCLARVRHARGETEAALIDLEATLADYPRGRGGVDVQLAQSQVDTLRRGTHR